MCLVGKPSSTSSTLHAGPWALKGTLFWVSQIESCHRKIIHHLLKWSVRLHSRLLQRGREIELNSEYDRDRWEFKAKMQSEGFSG